jgi:DNA-binding LacI/PurR family transcriptional regulator
MARMHPLRVLSAAEQVALHLRREMERGRWSGTIAGVNLLAAELGVNRKTVETALLQLEREGLLARQGAGRKRLIVRRARGIAPRPIRIALMLCERADRRLEYVVELQHALFEAGHTVFIPDKVLFELGMNVEKIGRVVRRTEADAWVLMAGAREVLEWFACQTMPSFAIFGQQIGLPIAGVRVDKPHAYAAAARRLVELGHRRIVILTRRMGGLPQPKLSERAFLAELERLGVRTSAYNLPVWEETVEGLQELLYSIFRVTPPTALIVDEAPLFAATKQFLARRGMKVPEQASLICTDPDPTFAWCKPSIAHIHWDARPLVRRVVHWAAAVSRGRRDIRQTLIPAEFESGGSIGPAPAD